MKLTFLLTPVLLLLSGCSSSPSRISDMRWERSLDIITLVDSKGIVHVELKSYPSLCRAIGPAVKNYYQDFNNCDTAKTYIERNYNK